MTTAPLTLPDNFNPQTFMLSNVTENGIFHESRSGAGLAEKLVANGTPQDLELAEKVLNVVLNCQERRQDDPHVGNFYWMIEDQVVFDLNAVEFCLEHLIPMMIDGGNRLSPQMQTRVLDAIRLGLQEIQRLNVLIAYSNITALDVLNSSLGGELLGDAHTAERGYRKLVEWMTLTDANGIPFEYNSPTYTRVTINTLNILVNHVQDADTRIRARTFLARLGVSVGLHIHMGSERWTGPHSRVYHPTVLCETPAELGLVREWIDNNALPDWVEDTLTCRPDVYEISETASTERGLGITTYQSPAVALGTSVCEAGGQSDVMMAHYVRPGVERPGVFYTRYLLNDKWMGDFYHQTDRTKTRNLVEEGQFFGVQQGPRAIGLYTLPKAPGVISSAKAALIWTGREHIDEIWIGDHRVTELPAEVPPGETVVVGSGEALFAVRPLARTDLGRSTPVLLADIQGDLVLEIFNYKGTAKPFWELGWPGAFYQGRPQCGYYLEVAERSDYVDGRAFGKTVDAGLFTEHTDAGFVFTGIGQRKWSVEYARDNDRLGIEIDLMLWQLNRRWTSAGEMGWPMLESLVARENRQGHVSVGDAHLTCGSEAGWLFACPQKGRYAVGYHGLLPAPLALDVPEGRVEIDAMGTGTLVWDNGKVLVEAVGLRGTPRVTLRA